MRFALVNTVPPGFCRKMHILAPGGRLADLAKLRRDDLPTVGLSPTHMEAIQGFVEWNDRALSPCLGLTMWYLESVQGEAGGFLRTEDAPSPSIGVAIRFLQIAGANGISRRDYESVNRAATWLEQQIDDDGLIRMPISGLVDFGMIARAVKALASVGDQQPSSRLSQAACTLSEVRTSSSQWATYPNGEPSTGATSLVLDAIASAPHLFDLTPDPAWLIETQNEDGGWGEFTGSPSKIDNTFWALRACVASGAAADVSLGSREVAEGATASGDERLMADRLLVLRGAEPTAELADRAMQSLTEDADRYAETALSGLALSEALALEREVNQADETAQALPLRTPDFIRQEPPLYDQLTEVSNRKWWLRLVEGASRRRLAEASIGWVAGLSAAIAMVGEELVNGLEALPVVAILGLLGAEILLVAGWLAARHERGKPLSGIPHLLFAFLLSSLLVLLVVSPPEVDVSLLPAAVLAVLLALIVEAIAVVTDKADLLNRLGDD